MRFAWIFIFVSVVGWAENSRQFFTLPPGYWERIERERKERENAQRPTLAPPHETQGSFGRMMADPKIQNLMMIKTDPMEFFIEFETPKEKESLVAQANQLVTRVLEPGREACQYFGEGAERADAVVAHLRDRFSMLDQFLMEIKNRPPQIGEDLDKIFQRYIEKDKHIAYWLAIIAAEQSRDYLRKKAARQAVTVLQEQLAAFTPEYYLKQAHEALTVVQKSALICDDILAHIPLSQETLRAFEQNSAALREETQANKGRPLHQFSSFLKTVIAQSGVLVNEVVRKDLVPLVKGNADNTEALLGALTRLGVATHPAIGPTSHVVLSLLRHEPIAAKDLAEFEATIGDPTLRRLAQNYRAAGTAVEYAAWAEALGRLGANYRQSFQRQRNFFR